MRAGFRRSFSSVRVWGIDQRELSELRMSERAERSGGQCRKPSDRAQAATRRLPIVLLLGMHALVLLQPIEVLLRADKGRDHLRVGHSLLKKEKPGVQARGFGRAAEELLVISLDQVL